MSDRSETEAHQKMAQGRYELKKEKEKKKKKERKGKETTLLEIKTVTPVCDMVMCPPPACRKDPC